MEFRPNRELITQFLAHNYEPKNLSWVDDFSIYMLFKNQKSVWIYFNRYDFKASSSDAPEIITALNEYRKTVGVDYIQQNLMITNKEILKAYNYLQSCVENINENRKNELIEFLDKHGEDIQKIFPEFSVNQKDWEHWETGEKGEKCYISEAYTLIFHSTEVKLNNADGFYLTTFDWSDTDETE